MYDKWFMDYTFVYSLCLWVNTSLVILMLGYACKLGFIYFIMVHLSPGYFTTCYHVGYIGYYYEVVYLPSDDGYWFVQHYFLLLFLNVFKKAIFIATHLKKHLLWLISIPSMHVVPNILPPSLKLMCPTTTSPPLQKMF